MAKEQKIKAVEELRKLIDSYSTVGIIDMNKLGAKQLQEVKKALRRKANIMITKKTILLRAIRSSSREKIGDLEKLAPLQPAIVLTNEDPFKFYAVASKLKSPTFAKEGDVAEDEIFVAAGPTGLMPGPVISEFAKVKIPAGVEEGKISVKKDTVVAKKGDKISKDLAVILRKLKIQPINVGIIISAVYEKGMIYVKDTLDLVGENYLNKIKQAFNEALNLSVAIGYPTKENVAQLLAKAYRQAQAVEKIIKQPSGGSN